MAVFGKLPHHPMKKVDEGGGGGHAGASVRRFKHIILGIDGTWQAAYSDPFHSNVFRLNVALNYRDKTPEQHSQVFIYSAGVGTANKSARLRAGAFGEGLDELILQAYINLVSNYEPNDKIYVFGFSRGAVAARALTAFISSAGLLKANSASLIEDAWKYFVGEQKTDYLAKRADNTHANVTIEFLGVWDTVTGPYKQNEIREKYRFSNLKLDRNVKRGIQILATDETRRDFRPMFWTGASADKQAIEQIWIPGVHTDIGGGYARIFISNVSLLVMIDKLAQYCPTLDFDEDYIANTLIENLKVEEPVVNDEWKDYWSRWIRSLIAEVRLVNNIKDHGCTRHPLCEYLQGKNIFFKSKQRKTYSPLLRVSDPSNPTGVLPLTQFTLESWHQKLVDEVLKHRV